MNHALSKLRPMLLPALTLCAAAAGLPGCRGERSADPPRQFLPDMDDQQKYKPQSQTEFFTDGRSMRPAVEGAVPFGRSTDPAEKQRDVFLHADRGFSAGMSEDGKYLDSIPQSALDAFDAGSKGNQLAMTAMLARGQERFNIYCSACHGYQGDGKGMVGLRWSSQPPSYHQDKYVDRTVDTGKDGYLFHVVREGVYDEDAATHERKYRMPPYGHAVTERDAWAIVSYVRALQASWTTDVASIPTDKRAMLEKKPRPAKVEAPAAAPAGSPAGAPAPAPSSKPEAPAAESNPTKAPGASKEAPR